MKYLDGFELLHNLIKKRWVPEILHSIKKGNDSYTSILNSIDYLSDTELNRKLRLLLDYKCIERREESSYKLTSFGDEMDHIFSHISDLGERYVARLKA